VNIIHESVDADRTEASVPGFWSKGLNFFCTMRLKCLHVKVQIYGCGTYRQFSDWS